LVKIYRLKLQEIRSIHSLTDFELGYLAGLWDGEGWLGFDDARAGRYYPSAQLGICDPHLYEIAKKCDRGGICAHGTKTGKIEYVWFFHGKSLKEFLETIGPGMIVKKDQALLLLEAFKYKGNKEKLKEIDAEMRRLKETELPVPEELMKGQIVAWLAIHGYSMSAKGRHVYRQRKRKVSI